LRKTATTLQGKKRIVSQVCLEEAKIPCQKRSGVPAQSQCSDISRPHGSSGCACHPAVSSRGRVSRRETWLRGTNRATRPDQSLPLLICSHLAQTLNTKYF